MSRDWISRPHIKIPSENVRRRPMIPRQPPPKKGVRKNPEECGRALISQLEESVRYCNRPEKIIRDEGVFFILKTEGAIFYKEAVLNRFGLTLSLQMDEDSAVVSIDTQFLERFRDALVRYAKKSELRSYIDQLNSISLVKFQRTSRELNEWLESSQEPLAVEIEILPNLKDEQYTSLISRVSDFLKAQGDDLLDSRIRDKSASVRALLKPQTAKRIFQGMDSLWQARQAPKIIIGKPQSVKLKEPPSPKQPDPDINSICVLDTGVDQNHPFLRNVVVDAVDLTSDNVPQDSTGHGTFVAGLAAYGELENRLDPKASARIISAKILGSNPSEYPYLENLIEQAVARYKDSARIFSLSVMYPQCCDISRPTELAYTIDKLSHDNGVTFVVCTGNVIDELPQLLQSLSYPTYLGDARCKIYVGAEACASVTVGGVASKDSDRSIAKKNEPSPFTRRGETGQRGKPDVVSWAGNIEREVGSEEINLDGEKLGVYSLALSPEILACDSGTSYAAPIVSNILARLSKEYPDAGPNLLKALLVHFAYLPDEYPALNAGNELKKNLYGKGIADFQRCAYSTSSCAGYILEDEIEHDEIAWAPFYVPKIMKKIYGEKRIRVTLVYDPLWIEESLDTLYWIWIFIFSKHFQEEYREYRENGNMSTEDDGIT